MKYPWSTTLSCEDIGIRKLEFVVKLRQEELDPNPRFCVTHEINDKQFSFLSCVGIDLACIVYYCVLCIYDNRTFIIYPICSRKINLLKLNGLCIYILILNLSKLCPNWNKFDTVIARKLWNRKSTFKLKLWVNVHKTQQMCSLNRPILLNLWFKTYYVVKLLTLWQHQMHFSFALTSSFYSTVFWFSLYYFARKSLVNS